jgi:hypothetical protein
MELAIPEAIAIEARKAAQKSGTCAETVLLEVLRVHFPPLPDALAVEFEAWDRAADEDSARVVG